MTLDELLDALGGEWAMGVNRLNQFEQLFGKAEHVELLNLIGGPFFARMQHLLMDDLRLCVSRLTDAPQSGKDKKNLTVRQLLDFCECDKLREEVKEQVEAAEQAAGESARRHRNKRISHKDLAYAIGDSELPSTTLGQIRRALDAVHAALQTVYRELQSTHLAEEVVDQGPGVAAFLGRTQRLVDAVLCIEELLADLSGRKPAWDEDVARDCIGRLGGTPSDENVERIVSLRRVAGWLRRESGAAE